MLYRYAMNEVEYLLDDLSVNYMECEWLYTSFVNCEIIHVCENCLCPCYKGDSVGFSLDLKSLI